MATVTAYQPINTLQPGAGGLGVVVQATSTDIVVQTGAETDIWHGSGFTYSNGQLVGGTVQWVTAYVNNQQALLIDDIGLPATTVYAYAHGGNINGLLPLFFEGTDLVYGSAGVDWIGGYAGNDVIVGAGGNDVIDGGSGLDTSYYLYTSSYYRVSHSGSNIVVTGIEGTDTLSGIERLDFADGRIAFDTDDTNGAGAAYRIYQAAFDRTPDVGGLTYWVGQADGGMSTIEMSARFIDSNEFRQLYGSSNLPADDFVSQVYENVLHRAGEQTGVDYWIGQINAGMSEAEVLARFADSAENRAEVIGIISNGIWLNPEGNYA